jgi:hypothetical protein
MAGAAEKFVPAGECFVPGRELFSRTAAALRLPQDTLSLTLLAFARFFSLTPEPSLIGKLRRELLTAGRPSMPADKTEAARLEAEALGALAAVGKGVRLGPEALERYAACLSGGFSSFSREKDSPQGQKQDAPDREELPLPEELKILGEKAAGKDALLSWLNRLPGKNGQRWMVFPLDFTVRGTELRAFVRILIEDSLFSVIADVAGPKRAWRFFLENRASTVSTDIQVFPGLSPAGLKALEKEAERFLGTEAFGPSTELRVHNGEELPSWAADLFEKVLPSINEEV